MDQPCGGGWAAAKYPFDPRRSEQLMAEAAYTRGGDGTWTHPTFGRFSSQLAVLQSPQNENEAAIMAAGWRQVGFDIREDVWPAPTASDAQFRSTYPGLSTTGGPARARTLMEHNSVETPQPERRWQGANRGGWINPEFDRLAEAFNTSIDRNERQQLLLQAVRIFTQDAAVISLYFNPSVVAVARGLTGPRPVVPDADLAWNIHEWELR